MLIPTTVNDPDIIEHASKTPLACNSIEALSRHTLWKALDEEGNYAGFIGLWIKESWGMPGCLYAYGVMATTKPMYGLKMAAWLQNNMPSNVVLVIWSVLKCNPRVYRMAKHMGFTEQAYAELMVYERADLVERDNHCLAKWL
jgi:hypothetical protein